MTKPLIDLYAGRPVLDIVSYGRGVRGDRIQLSRAKIEQIARTVRRAPEVMIKVLPKDSNIAKSIRNHIDYIGRYGKLELEGDDDTRVSGKKAGEKLVEDWDLDLETNRRESEFKSTRGRCASKLVHKLIFSMPPGTPPQGVLAAVRDFARNEFALKQRYAMVLHTDEPHPHVHVIIKAVSEQGERLSIDKSTLRAWREEFARQLRAHGIEANATERAVRGESRIAKKDGIYRANVRGDSTYLRKQAESVVAEQLRKDSGADSGKRLLLDTRKNVMRGWWDVAEYLSASGRGSLAEDVRQFVARMSPPRTEREMALAECIRRLRACKRQL